MEMQNPIEKTFYYFPYKRNVNILYSDSFVLSTNIFNMFCNKLFPTSILIDVLKYGHIKTDFLKQHLSVIKRTPNKMIPLIYSGYDNELYFEFNNTKEFNNSLYSMKNGIFQKVNYLGLPIYYNYKSKLIQQTDLLESFLTSHLLYIMKGGSLHGDFTNFNLLINNNTISPIDSIINFKNSPITDHFYFYTYFLLSVAKKNKKNFHIIKSQLDLIYKSIFRKFRVEKIKILTESIDYSKLGCPETRFYKKTFLKLFDE